MIPIKINGQTQKVPTFNELTVKQYIEYTKIFRKKKKFDIIDYLSLVLKQEYKLVYFSKIHNVDGLMNVLGHARDYRKLKPGKQFVIAGDYYNLDNYLIETVGQRFMIQENAKRYKTDEELLCFVLAVSIIREVNLIKIQELKNKIMNEPYVDILPTAFFLSRSLISGLNKGKNIFQRLRRLISTIH